MFPQYNDLRPMADYQFKVDFQFYVNLGYITQEQCNELTEINNKNIPTPQQ